MIHGIALDLRFAGKHRVGRERGEGVCGSFPHGGVLALLLLLLLLLSLHTCYFRYCSFPFFSTNLLRLLVSDSHVPVPYHRFLSNILPVWGFTVASSNDRL